MARQGALAGDLGIDRVIHVKVPVSDVVRSARWYAALFNMRLAMEFVEEDELRGVVLVEPVSGFRVALRGRIHSAGTPVLAGFDLFALEMTSLEALQGIADRCDRLGIAHSGAHHFHGGAGWMCRTQMGPSCASTLLPGGRRSWAPEATTGAGTCCMTSPVCRASP